MQHNEAILRYASAKGYTNACVMIYRSVDYKDANIFAMVLPMHMLGAFALELYLKAWLLGASGASKDVKEFGHNIALLYNNARERGLPDIDRLENLKDHLASPHGDYTFRYINRGDKINNTNWPLAFKILTDLDKEVDAFVGASTAQGLKPGH